MASVSYRFGGANGNAGAGRRFMAGAPPRRAGGARRSSARHPGLLGPPNLRGAAARSGPEKNICSIPARVKGHRCPEGAVTWRQPVEPSAVNRATDSRHPGCGTGGRDRSRPRKEEGMDRRNREFERVAEAQRTTKGEARAEGIGVPDRGTELPARSYADETGVADLGVDEPVVSPPGADVDSDPTGLFAGDTEADIRDEDGVRRVLEHGFPDTEGTWKEGGRVPSAPRRPPDR